MGAFITLGEHAQRQVGLRQRYRTADTQTLSFSKWKVGVFHSLGEPLELEAFGIKPLWRLPEYWMVITRIRANHQ